MGEPRNVCKTAVRTSECKIQFGYSDVDGRFRVGSSVVLNTVMFFWVP
jgi:hypothetical protein